MKYKFFVKIKLNNWSYAPSNDEKNKFVGLVFRRTISPHFTKLCHKFELSDFITNRRCVCTKNRHTCARCHIYHFSSCMHRFCIFVCETHLFRAEHRISINQKWCSVKVEFFNSLLIKRRKNLTQKYFILIFYIFVIFLKKRFLPLDWFWFTTKI